MSNSKQDKTSDWLSQNKKKDEGFQYLKNNFKAIDNNHPTQRGMAGKDAGSAPKIQGKG